MVDAASNSSMTTIFALVNLMVGGAMLTFPVLFRDSGLAMGSFLLLLSGYISYKTCWVYLFHLSPGDVDIEAAIKRVLGPKWYQIFRIISGFYLLLLTIIYIDLIIDQTYAMLYFIFHAADKGDWIAGKEYTQLVFDRFSVQYMSLIYFLPLLAVVFIKNLGLLIKMAELGAYSAFIYFAFIIYYFGTSIGYGTIIPDNIVWFSSNVGNLAGGCALAFTIHTVFATVLKSNKYQDKNHRDLALSYVVGFVMYLLIGILGSLAIQDLTCKHTIVDCYLNNWQVLFVEISYLFGRITVFPCVLSISRTRLLEQFYGEVNPKKVKIFNIIFISIATMFSFLSPYLPIDLVMNLVGSIVCYFFIYAIPTKMHYECLFGKVARDSLIESIESIEMTEDPQQPVLACPHAPYDGRKHIKIWTFVFYIVLNVIGIAIGIYGVYSFFAGFFQ